jgi:hypothetical protein
MNGIILCRFNRLSIYCWKGEYRIATKTITLCLPAFAEGIYIQIEVDSLATMKLDKYRNHWSKYHFNLLQILQLTCRSQHAWFLPSIEKTLLLKNYEKEEANTRELVSVTSGIEVHVQICFRKAIFPSESSHDSLLFTIKTVASKRGRDSLQVFA